MRLFAPVVYFVVLMLSGFVLGESYPVDPVCATLGRSPRDAAQNENIYLRQREQQCKIPLKGGGVALYTYDLNSVSVPVIERAMVFIYPHHLDTGDAINDSARVYAIKLGGQKAVAGAVLGASLGGSGSNPANIFSTSNDAQEKYSAFESAIYKCIKSGQSTSARLRWVFSYRTKADTAPYAVEYTANFQGGPNNCASMVQSFEI